MPTYLLIALAALIAGTLDTVAGLGGALLLAPMLVMLVGAKQAVILGALISFGWNVPRIIVLRSAVDWRAALLFTIGIVPGVYLGAHLLDTVDAKSLEMAIGSALILFGGYYILRLYLDIPSPRGLRSWAFPIVGFVSGIIGALLGAGHGPIQTGALAAAELPVRQIAATNGVLGGVTALARLAGYGAEGMMLDEIWLPGLIGVTAAAAGALLGIRLSKRAKDATLELVIGVVVIIAGAKMLLAR